MRLPEREEKSEAASKTTRRESVAYLGRAPTTSVKSFVSKRPPRLKATVTREPSECREPPLGAELVNTCILLLAVSGPLE